MEGSNLEINKANTFNNSVYRPTPKISAQIEQKQRKLNIMHIADSQRPQSSRLLASQLKNE